MIFRCGTMFCLNGLGVEQRIYTRGDGEFGPDFSVVNTPTPPALGGDDVYWGQFDESPDGDSNLTLAPRWSQNTSGWTIFGGMVRFGVNWPCNLFDCLMFELLGGGVLQAGIYGEASSGDIFLVDSAGNQAISLADPTLLNAHLLYVAAVQLTDPGDSKLWIYSRSGFLQASGTGTGNNFQTGTPLTMTYLLQGQNHGGQPLGSPTRTLILNPFVFDGSTDPVADHPKRVAGLFYTCSDGGATPPFTYGGSTSSPQVASDGVWSDTDDELGSTDVEYDNFGTGGMNVVDGPKDDARLDASTKIWGGGICIHTDSDFSNTSSTDVSAGRYSGAGSVQDRVDLRGATYGGGRTTVHGTTLIVDNLAFGDQLVAGHLSNDFDTPRDSKINAMRGWVLVDPSTFVAGGVTPLVNRQGSHLLGGLVQ